jgi:hypothetical protein
MKVASITETATSHGFEAGIEVAAGDPAGKSLIYRIPISVSMYECCAMAAGLALAVEYCNYIK